MINILLSFYKLIKFKILAARKLNSINIAIISTATIILKNNHNEIREISSDIKVKNEDDWPDGGYTVTLNE